MDRAAVDAAYQLGVTTGRRDALARLAAELRGQAARWRAEDASGKGVLGGMRAALAWRLTERWCGRLEHFCTKLDDQAAQLQTAEQTQRATLERVAAALAPKRRWLPWG